MTWSVNLSRHTPPRHSPPRHTPPCHSPSRHTPSHHTPPCHSPSRHTPSHHTPPCHTTMPFRISTFASCVAAFFTHAGQSCKSSIFMSMSPSPVNDLLPAAG